MTRLDGNAARKIHIILRPARFSRKASASLMGFSRAGRGERRAEIETVRCHPAAPVVGARAISLACLDGRLHMGSWSTVSNLLRKTKSAKSED